MTAGRPTDVCLVGLIAGGRAGIARYAISLTRALGEVAPEHPGLRLRLVTTPAGREAVGDTRLRVSVARLPGRFNHGPPRIAAEQILAAARRADFLYFFDLTGPLLAPRRPFVSTVHDVSLGSGLNRRRHAYKRALWPWAARRARRLVAVSGFTADEATRRFGISRDKLAVVHSGPGLSEAAARAMPEDGARRPYFLYVGDLTTRKNVPFLIRAFDSSGVDADLLLVGKADDDASSEVREAVARARNGGRIRILGPRPDAEVDGLYRSALALVMPSRYEGFGFTPLEAMSRRCPVVESDIPALREVSGDGALLVPLDDEVAWAESLRRVAADESLRADLARRGSETVARYSWQETARGVCSVLAGLGPR